MISMSSGERAGGGGGGVNGKGGRWSENVSKLNESNTVFFCLCVRNSLRP